ncbi:MAG: hypothetical protein NTY53_23780 [Kiritimatiellaeota bacterium]|nr:hypothetical protein [Kiritimatiellota bacterium]
MKPQDVLVALKLLTSGWPGSYAVLGLQLGMSPSMAHSAVSRARREGLLHPLEFVPIQMALAEFLVHGVRYVFPAELGSPTRGMPTSYAVPPLSPEISTSPDELVPVWPDPDGTMRGSALKPLYHSVPKAARKDAKLYEWLVLVDALRVGRARERELASKIISTRLNYAEFRRV